MTEHVDIICVYDNKGFSAPIEYTFDLLLSTFDVEYKVLPLRQVMQQGDYPAGALLISYGCDCIDPGDRKQIHIYASDFFGADYLKLTSLPRTPVKKYDGLPVIYRGSGQFDWVRRGEGLLETNIDIIASSFFMVSRYEEVVLDVKDEHDRFPASASLALQEGFLDRPIVNECIELLWSWIQDLMPGLKRRQVWPQGKDFAVCLTHDVDRLRKYRLSVMAQAGLHRVISLLMAKGGHAVPQPEGRPSPPRWPGVQKELTVLCDWSKVIFKLKKDPFDTFDYMLELERRYGFKSSFYFMAGGNSEFDNRYSVTDRGVVRLISTIEETGSEAGLHPSYNSCNQSEHMLSEKAAMDRVVSDRNYGCRQHYLRWKTPDTWRVQEGAGLFYDTTLSFADHTGFRCGFCLPYRPFDVIDNRALNTWELPLIVQEGTLKGANYENLLPKAAYRETVRLIEAVRKCQGVFVLLWHNSSFDPLDGWGGWRDVYEGLMQYIREQNAWVTSGREIIEWWREGPRLLSSGGHAAETGGSRHAQLHESDIVVDEG